MAMVTEESQLHDSIDVSDVMEIFGNNIRNKYSWHIFIKYIPWEYSTEIFDTNIPHD